MADTSPATDRERIVLSSLPAQLRGVIGRYPAPDEAYVFEFDAVARRPIHMLGVRRPLRVEWFIDDDRVRTARLRPWIGYGAARANRVVERRPGAASGGAA
jgi:uncharacterized membrane protein (UPF0127 family)